MFIPTQLVIVAICLFLHFFRAVPLEAVGVFVIVMELFSILGALWFVRLRKKIERARNVPR
jgi:hypothetical protein